MARNFTREEIIAEIRRRKALEQQKSAPPRQKPSLPDTNTRNVQTSGLPNMNSLPPHQSQPQSSLPQQPNSTSNTSEVKETKFAIDPKTNKKYKKLAGQSEVIHGAGIDAMLRHGTIDEDIEADDLNSSADVFLSHLQVPPDKNELEKLREERIKQRKKQNAEYKKSLETIKDE